MGWDGVGVALMRHSLFFSSFSFFFKRSAFSRSTLPSSCGAVTPLPLVKREGLGGGEPLRVKWFVPFNGSPFRLRLFGASPKWVTRKVWSCAKRAEGSTFIGIVRPVDHKMLGSAMPVGPSCKHLGNIGKQRPGQHQEPSPLLQQRSYVCFCVCV